jgi:hypothetical protein
MKNWTVSWVTCSTMLLAIIAATFTSCAKDGVEEKQTDNQRFRVTRLFTNEGCTLYRFTDDGYSRYYTNCSGSTQWQEQHGKTSSPAEVTGSQ